MKKKVKKLVPELRFSEFKDNWEKLSIEKIASVSSGGTPSRTESTYWNGNIPWITTSETNQSEIFDSVEKITEKGLKNSSAKLFPKDTILMAMYGQGKTRGQVSLLRIGAATSQNFAAIVLKKNYLPEFIYLFLSQEYKRLRALSNGNAHQSLSSGLIRSYKVPITSLEEQKKIAKFLDSVNLRITQLRCKHELLETYKKGVMQKIFSRQIRFKQDSGKPFPDWEKKKLNTISEPIKRQLESGEAIVMSISSGSGFVDQKERFNQVIAGSSLKKYILIKKHEFSYNRGASKAFPYGCIHMMEEEEALIPFVYRTFRLTEGITYFYAQYFSTGYIDRQLRKMISSSARMDGLLNIGEKDFFTIKLPLPVNEEQKKIANFLISIDKKIDSVCSQIEKLEEFKKGLLQKMFV